jgi:hypothetical protein
VKFCTKHNLDVDAITTTKNPDALMVPCNSLDMEVEKIRLGAAGPDATVVLHLTGTNNFRYKLATLQPYKGNRVNDKPHWYHEMRKHLVEKHGATIWEDYEADDRVVIEQQLDPDCVISHIDKDIDQSVGWHWNPKKQEKYYLDEHQCAVNFYTQFIQGDATDNIMGLFKATGKRAPNGYKTAIQELPDALSMFRYVWDRHREGSSKSDLDTYNDLKEIGGLLYMLRTPTDVYEPILTLEELLSEQTSA